MRRNCFGVVQPSSVSLLAEDEGEVASLLSPILPSSPVSWQYRVGAWVILVFGMLAMVVGTGTTISKIISDDAQ
jgi:hypothetical protein